MPPQVERLAESGGQPPPLPPAAKINGYVRAGLAPRDMNNDSGPSRPQPHPSGRRVLLVEVDPQSAELQKAILEQAGFVVQLAEGGREALRIIGVDPPAAVVIEACLPVLSGFEVCEQLKADSRTEHLPVLICSSTPSDADEAFRVGASGFVSKPDEIMELPGRLRRLLGT